MFKSFLLACAQENEYELVLYAKKAFALKRHYLAFFYTATRFLRMLAFCLVTKSNQKKQEKTMLPRALFKCK